MRILPLAFLALALPAPGCTAFFVASGRQPSELTEERVKADYGSPLTLVDPDGRTSAVGFRTRHKIAEPNKWIYAAMGTMATGGLIELVTFPHELYRAGRTTLVGCDVRVDYYPTGEVKQVFVNDESIYTGPEPPVAP